MFRKKENNKEINIKNVNELVDVGNKVLKIFYVLIFLACGYAITILIKEWRILHFLLVILNIVAPLFIGILIAWLFDPIVKWLQKKGIRRLLGSIIVYILLLLFVYLVLGSIIPLLSEQINDLATTLPNVIDAMRNLITKVFDKLGRIDNFDTDNMKLEIFRKIEEYGVNITRELPTIMVNIVKTAFSGAGTILVGLIIGFYLLISFDNVSDNLISLLPKRFRRDTKELTNETNTILRNFVKGALIDSFIVFMVSSLGFFLVGLKSPLLFGLFCGITNVIPYAGPYIGGAPAVIIGLSQGSTVGILTLVVIVVVQTLEGNFLQPIIMSKTTKLHPVTIMLGLLLFGHFFGIIGMFISTPIIGVLKSVFMFFEEKYHFLSYKDEIYNNEIVEEEK